MLLRRCPGGAALALVTAGALLVSLIYAVLGIRIHQTLHTTAFDLAFFDQIIWNTAHGRLFHTTYVQYNFLGQHFELILLPIALLYRLGAGPAVLISLQALAVGLAALPLFLAGRRIAGPLPACLVAFAYLVSPTLQRGADFGFHPDLFVPLLVFGGFAALGSGRRVVFCICAFILLSIKEDTFLVAAGLGWLCILCGDRRLGRAVIAVSVAWGILVLGVVMPFLRHGQPSDLTERYGYLGATVPGIVAGAFLHFDRVLHHLTAPEAVIAVILILACAGFLPLLAPEAMIAAIPAALVALLATHPQQRVLDLQYGAPVLALVFLSALIGLQRLRRFVSTRSVVASPHGSSPRVLVAASSAAMAFSLCLGYWRGPFPLERQFHPDRFVDNGDVAALRRITQLMPADASVSAQSGLLPHLSQRRLQWEFPKLEGATYAVLQANGVRSSQGSATYPIVCKLLPTLGYDEVARDHGIYLFARRSRGDAAAIANEHNRPAPAGLEELCSR